MQYDPTRDLDPVEWNAVDEAERMRVVEEWHRQNQIKLPNARVHAIVHTVVENQIAMGDDFPAKAVLARLMREGLDRHEAVHAIGSVVAAQLFSGLRDPEHHTDMSGEYLDKLQALTAESWRKVGEE